MKTRKVIWPPSVKEKLLHFRSQHFTSKETLDFIIKLIIDIEKLLTNDFVGQTYTEEIWCV